MPVSPSDLSASAQCGREFLSLDQGWRFHLGEIPMPTIKGHGASYANAKAGVAWGAAAPDHDDTDWRVLDLPHDWAVEGPFDPDANLSQGYRRRGIAWYRRHFVLPETDRGRHLELRFDGVATHCTVWLNGTVVHRNWCGYTSFHIDLTPFAKFGRDQNTLAIRVDADAMEGWWYEGAGIYRHTWLVKRAPVHIATDGVFAHPVRLPDGGWRIPAEITVANAGRAAAEVTAEIVLFDPAGREVLRRRTPAAALAALDQTVLRLDLAVAEPELWSVDRPALYRVVTTALHDGAVVDLVTTHCGFRTARFDADAGFLLNDRPLKLRGVCNHQDHAGVGVAMPASLWEFRLRRLKEMGVNACRCAHNPPAAEFLAACDRLGVLVMDENRHFNPTPEYVRQLEWLVRRDRNHPSVILWSVFNEEPMQGSEQGHEMVRRMVAVVKRLDATRPVTAAMNHGLFSPVNVAQAVDVVGFNYQPESYDRFHAANPTLPLTSSEDVSSFMTRGAFVTDPARNVVGSYDTEAATWGVTRRASWRAISGRPWLAGAFVWTGFDYRGEPTPHEWPSASSFFGALDLCGFAKTAFHLHRAHWIRDRPVLHLAPHWNRPGRGDGPVKVLALTNADSVALFLNDRALGEKPVDPCDMASWEIPYEPGELRAVAFRAGVEIARCSVETTGKPVALRLAPDRAALVGDGRDAQPITVEAVDDLGRPVPDANVPVAFELDGPGVILGHGNGDPNCHELERGPTRSLFNGLAQVIVQTRRGATGVLTLRARSEGLAQAEITIPVEACEPSPVVPVVTPLFALHGWRISPASATRPDPAQAVAENDQNSWTWLAPGHPLPLVDGRWALIRLAFTPPASMRREGCRLVLEEFSGRAEVWIDGILAARKDAFAPATITVPLSPAEGARRASILVEADEARPVGPGGLATLENNLAS